MPSAKELASRAVAYAKADGGERGIRTLDTVLPIYLLSRKVPSATRPFLLLSANSWKLVRYKLETEIFFQELAALILTANIEAWLSF